MLKIQNMWNRFWAWLPVFGLVLLVLSTLVQTEALTAGRIFAILIIIFASCIFLEPLSSRFLPWAVNRFAKNEDFDAMSAEIFIQAPWEDVWDIFEPRPREDSFIMGVSKIEAAMPSDEGAKRIAFVMDKATIGFDKRYIAEVETRIPERFIRLNYVKPHPETMGMKVIYSEYEIHPTETGTWVRYFEKVYHRGMVSRLIINLVSPAKDVLKSLKAQVEGTEDHSIAGRVALAKNNNESLDGAIFAGTVVQNGLKILPLAAVGITVFLPIFLWAIMTLALG